MNNLRKVARRALEVLTWLEPEGAVVTAARSAAIDDLRAELDQPVQEPVAREWQSLSEDEIYYIWDGYLSKYQLQMIRDIEAALKEKNHE